MIQFTIPGMPKGKGRPRFVKATGASYTPQDTANYENWVKVCYLNAKQEKIEGADTPISATIYAYYPIPKSTTKANRAAMEQFKIRPTKKPDCDNIIKIILDSLNGIAFDDDKQVVEITMLKQYTPREPEVLVVLRTIDQEEGRKTH